MPGAYWFDVATPSSALIAQLESSRPTVRDDSGRLLALVMAECAQLDIHARTTRILRVRGDASDRRETLVCAGPARRAGCGICASPVDHDAQFCGMCGARSRVRVSLVGTVIDELYAVEEKLAEGDTSTIYRARYVPGGQALALKVLHPELTYDALAVTRFRREGKCLARLRDPHTVTVYDHGEDSRGTFYIAMELLDGEGLDVRVRTRGALPWREVLTVMRGVCAALEEAHAHGIVHRNLTPRNIRRGANDEIKVIDFGLAKLGLDTADEELTFAGQAVGSAQYMAPEQMVTRTCDGRADLYALGVICLELVLGQERRPGTFAAMLPPGIPVEVERLLKRCLAADPDARTASAAELANEIDSVLAPHTPVGKPSQRLAFAHTSAFELQPPRIVIDLARGSEPSIEVEPVSRSRWKRWAAALVVCGICLGTAVVGCV